MLIDLAAGPAPPAVEAPAAAFIDRAINGPGPSGIPTAGVVIEPHEGPPRVIALYRAVRWRDGAVVSSRWTATLAGADLKPRQTVTTDACPALGPHLDQLAALQPGGLVTPPSLTPPRRAPHGALYTVWGRGQSAEGDGRLTRVAASTGPVADWSARLGEIVADCAARPAG